MLGRTAGVVVLMSSLGAWAQQCRIAPLQARQAAAGVGSLEWFTTGCELLECHLRLRTADAIATAEVLWQQAATSTIPGMRAAIAAVGQFAYVSAEGNRSDSPWAARIGPLDPAAAPATTGLYHLAHIRLLCLQGDHAGELLHAIPARVAADATGDPALRLLAAHIGMHAQPTRGLVSFGALLDELATRYPGETGVMRPYLHLLEFQELRNHGKDEAAAAKLAAAERLAVTNGDRRVQGQVLELRAALADVAGDHDVAVELQESAHEHWLELGDRHCITRSLDRLACLALRRDDLVQAAALVDECEQWLAGRQLPDCENEILSTRFELAVRRRDGDTAAEIRHEIERRQTASRPADQRLRETREQLRLAEESRVTAEQRLVEAAAAAEQRQWTYRAFGAAGAAGALAILVTVSWRSRRRLLTANTRLAEQIQRAEEANAERLRLEECMRQLERANSLGTLAAGVAHDFNNLLTSILGNAELLAMRHRDADSTALTDQIVQAGRQAARFCKQLQTYGGSTPLHISAVALGEFLRQSLPVLRTSVGPEVDIRIAVEADVTVAADVAQLEQVLLNLVLNARDAKARHIAIRTGSSPDEDGAAQAFLEVGDDGEGMSPEVAQRIFDPFFTTRFPGRGLGLAVVYGVARRHGGAITVETTPGQGARFRLRLPTTTARPPVAEPTVVLPSVPPPARPGTILVVDDETAVRELLARLLRELGHTALTCPDGAALLAALPTLPAAPAPILFVDLTMPDLEGTELIARARQVRSDVRTVLMSGHAHAMLEQAAAAAQPDGLLRKPFDAASVRRVVDEVSAHRLDAAR